MAAESDSRTPEALEKKLSEAEARIAASERDSTALRERIVKLEQEMAQVRRSIAGAAGRRG